MLDKVPKFTIDDGGVEISHTPMPRSLSEDSIRKAIEVIHDWEASDRTACQLIADLYPILVHSTSRQE